MTRIVSFKARVKLLEDLSNRKEYNGTLRDYCASFGINTVFIEALHDIGIVTKERGKITWIGTQKPFDQITRMALRRERSLRKESEDNGVFHRDKTRKSGIGYRKAALEAMYADQQYGIKKHLSHYYNSYGLGSWFTMALRKIDLLNVKGNEWEITRAIPNTGELFESIYKLERSMHKEYRKIKNVPFDEKPEQPTMTKPTTEQLNKEPAHVKKQESNGELMFRELLKLGVMIEAKKGLSEISRTFNRDSTEILVAAKKLREVTDVSYLMDEGKSRYAKIFD